MILFLIDVVEQLESLATGSLVEQRRFGRQEFGKFKHTAQCMFTDVRFGM
jgi:hypothetical protein